MYRENEIFGRNELLIGAEAMSRIGKTRVILFGVGGVGSWCAESLIRSGVKYLTLVDSDCISVTNINRQLPATIQTVGQPKTEALKERLLTINPHATITAMQTAYTADANPLFQLESYDYILDAIDSLEHKANLILHATQTNATLFSSMGAALKIDASHIQTAEFWKVHGCPLAAALRRRFRKNTLPAKKFLCVFSDELLENKGAPPVLTHNQMPHNQMPHDQSPHDQSPHEQSLWDKRKAQINGAMVHITAIFGFTLAGLLIQDIIKLPAKSFFVHP
jgi:tRNA A37 threonylcarbamoyladenosine dehydratase